MNVGTNLTQQSENGVSASRYLLDTDIVSNEFWSDMSIYQTKMREDGYVKFPDMFKGLASHISAEENEICSSMKSKNFNMPVLDSPRKMMVLNGEELSTAAPIFNTLYFHHEIRTFLSKVVGSDIHSVKHASEFMVSNMLRGNGDTHGWHLDDPQLAFVIFLKAPSPSSGGTLQYVKNWKKICSTYDIPLEEYLDTSVKTLGRKIEINSDHHQAGDAYLLDAKKHLHRVTPVKGRNASRWVVNMAFDTQPDIDFGDTANILYN